MTVAATCSKSTPAAKAAAALAALSLSLAPLSAASAGGRVQPGMVAIDRSGAPVGVILRTDATRDNQPAAEVLDSGARFTVRLNQIRLARRGERAVIELTPSQILTRAILSSG